MYATHPPLMMCHLKKKLWSGHKNMSKPYKFDRLRSIGIMNLPDAYHMVINPCAKYVSQCQTDKKGWTGHKSAQTYKRTDGRKDRHRDRQTDRQSDSYIHPP